MRDTQNEAITIPDKGESEFDTIVNGWNAANTLERKKRTAFCARTGHDKRDILYRGKRLYVVCARCCRYFNADEEY